MTSAEILLNLPENLITGTFVARIKRFSVEVLHGKSIIMAHTNNTGAMLGLPGSGAAVMLSPATSPKRKLPYTLERVWSNTGCQPGEGAGQDGFWIGVNTRIPNLILKAAFKAGLLPFAEAYERICMEVKHGASRLDACFQGEGRPRLWVECKNVTLVRNGLAAFPDAASIRAQKHLRSLNEIRQSGERAALFFAVQRPDARALCAAADIDPEYARLFKEALLRGVEAYAFEICQLPGGFALGRELPVMR